MNTIENNKLIAEFMGYETYQMNGYLNVHYSDDNIRTIQDTHYHTDWNLLIEVVSKIESLDFIFDIHHEVANIYNGENKSNGIYEETFQGATKISSVYNVCVEFIKWYNLQETV